MSAHLSVPHDPLESLARLVQESGITPALDPIDFVSGGIVHRAGLPRLHVYSHVHTRRVLAIDERLHAWRAAPGAPGAIEGYLPLPSLADAIAALDLERGERMKARTTRIVLLPEADTGDPS